MKMKHVIGALAICMVAATAAQAGTDVWVKYSEVKPKQVVTIPTPSGGTQSVYAGDYQLYISETVQTVGTTGPGGTLTDSFCVDVFDASIKTWQQYQVVDLSLAPDPVGNNMGGTKARDIKQLLLLAYPDALDEWDTKTATGVSAAQYAAAVQAAVWEIVNENETGASYSLGGGSWTTTGNSTTLTFANTLLGSINSDTSDLLNEYANVWAVTNDKYQDFAVVRIGVEPVPEPLTMASAFFAICGLGGYIRRRTGRAAA